MLFSYKHILLVYSNLSTDFLNFVPKTFQVLIVNYLKMNLG